MERADAQLTRRSCGAEASRRYRSAEGRASPARAHSRGPRTFTIEDGGRLSHSTSAATAIGVLTQEAAAVAAPESVPEPGSLVLLLTGIGGLLLRRSFAV